jgi:hypothetical protein
MPARSSRTAKRRRGKIQPAGDDLVVVRDEQRIARLRSLAKWLSLIGFLFLVAGLVMILVVPDTERIIVYQLMALFAGWILSQIGTYLAHRYLRRPRPDEVLDEAVRKAARNARLYHYVLPAPHVLLTSHGVIVFAAKFQGGNISVTDGDKWKQTGVGLRKYFGQEGLGNPTREAESMIQALAAYINKHAPGVEEVPMAGLIVFTAKELKQLDVAGSRIPAMHHTKVKGYLKQQWSGEQIAPADYEALRQAFDQAAPELTAGT